MQPVSYAHVQIDARRKKRSCCSQIRGFFGDQTTLRMRENKEQHSNDSFMCSGCSWRWLSGCATLKSEPLNPCTRHGQELLKLLFPSRKLITLIFALWNVSLYEMLPGWLQVNEEVDGWCTVSGRSVPGLLLLIVVSTVLWSKPQCCCCSGRHTHHPAAGNTHHHQASACASIHSRVWLPPALVWAALTKHYTGQLFTLDYSHFLVIKRCIYRLLFGPNAADWSRKAAENWKTLQHIVLLFFPR